MIQLQQNKKNRAYEAIKTMIVSHRMSRDDPLTELFLSKTLGIGRTPIREALNLLAKDGLIQLIPNKGFILRRISSDDLVRLYQVREVLDGLAAKHAAQRMDLSELERIDCKYLHGNDSDQEVARQLSSELHSLIYKSCGNPYLVETYEGFRLRVELGMNSLWQLWSGHADLIERRNREHGEIIRYLKDRDAEGAERMSREHISNVITDILHLIAGQNMG